MKVKIEDEKKLWQLQTDSDVKVAAAFVKSYKDCDNLKNSEEEIYIKTPPDYHNTEHKTLLNPQAIPFQPHHALHEASTNQIDVELAQTTFCLNITFALVA